MADWRWPTWLLLSLPVAWLAMCRLVLAPRFPETHALFGDWTVHAQSLPLFLTGYAVAGSAGFWQRIRALRWSTLRSEAHTSELQSLMRISYAVFCLKKKK